MHPLVRLQVIHTHTHARAHTHTHTHTSIFDVYIHGHGNIDAAYILYHVTYVSDAYVLVYPDF